MSQHKINDVHCVPRRMALVAATLLVGAPAWGTVSYSEPSSAEIEVTDLTGFMTTGADMGGMDVTAFFTGGASETQTWAATSATAGGVTGAGWSLSVDGDTYGAQWLVTSGANTPIVALELVGTPVADATFATGTVFDRFVGDTFGTDGSFRGLDLLIVDPATTDARVSYINPIDNLADGDGVVGDLFGSLRIDFTSGEITDDLLFTQDTDSIGIRQPPGDGPEFPEPATLGIAALGVLLIRRRQ